MKSCKRWITTAGATCALCRTGYPADTKGVLADLATAVDGTTIVKFVCFDCATQIAAAMAPGSSR
jgi:hypothetical protein